MPGGRTRDYLGRGRWTQRSSRCDYNEASSPRARGGRAPFTAVIARLLTTLVVSIWALLRALALILWELTRRLAIALVGFLVEKLRVEDAGRRAIVTSVARNALPTPGYFGLLGLAGFIATFGLISDSAAVIIGAMLVAPLMNSIVGLALANVRRNRALSEEAFRSLAFGVALVIFVAWIGGLMVPFPEAGTQITSRIRPTLLDLGIAVAAGLAGAYSSLRAEVSSVIPGVAIATALVPPLGVVGIQLSQGSWTGAGGAFLLFGSNLLAIYMANVLLFILSGFAARDPEDTHSRLRRYGLPVVALAVLAGVLGYSLKVVMDEQIERVVVRDNLKLQVRAIPQAQLAEVEQSRERDGNKPYLRVRATVRTPTSFAPEEVRVMERVLEERLRRKVRLTVRSIIAKDANAQGYLVTAADETVPGARASTADPLATARDMLLADQLGSRLISLADEDLGGTRFVTIRLAAPGPFKERIFRKVENVIRAGFEEEVDFRVIVETPEGEQVYPPPPPTTEPDPEGAEAEPSESDEGPSPPDAASDPESIESAE